MSCLSSLLVLLLLFGSVMGCKQYVPAPIDWAQEVGAGERAEVRLTSPEDAVLLALIGNRELNRLRLERAAQETVAQESGWWDDPEFAVDLKRIIDPSDHPFLGGASVVFTIPLSGVPQREAKLAEAFTATAQAEVLAAEHALAVQVRKQLCEIVALYERIHALEAMDDQAFRQAHEAVQQLYNAGEAGLSRVAMQQPRHARTHALIEARKALRMAEGTLLQQLGIRPEVTLVVAFTLDALTPETLPKVEVERLIAHPAVKLELARLDAADAQLQLELRRQYPDLKIGPVYANEEGLNRLGLTAGVTLPLWNRNRKAIAEAEGAREVARLSAIQCWQDLVCEAATVTMAYDEQQAHVPIAPIDRQAMDGLWALGELTPMEYLELRETLLEQTLLELEWQQQRALLAAAFTQFIIQKDPSYVD